MQQKRKSCLDARLASKTGRDRKENSGAIMMDQIYAAGSTKLSAAAYCPASHAEPVCVHIR
jgi:hypothetical protein